MLYKAKKYPEKIYFSSRGYFYVSAGGLLSLYYFDKLFIRK